MSQCDMDIFICHIKANLPTFLRMLIGGKHITECTSHA